jgi:hypothetical protein
MSKLNEVLAPIAPMLLELGFKKHAGQIFTLGIDVELLGWLGLNLAREHRAAGEVEINPVVGVRHQGVERLVAELCEEQFHSYKPPTISSPLGYLLPERNYKPWIFSGFDDREPAEEMMQAIRGYGLLFMRSVVTLQNLCQRIDDGMGFSHQLIYRRPVAWLLAGDPNTAGEIIRDEITSLGDRTDLAASRFRSFAKRFEAKLSQLD